MEEKLVRKLVTSMKCDSCGQHYEVCDVDVLGHRGDMWFLKINCSTCHTQCLVAAVVKKSKMPGAVTDHVESDIDEVVEAPLTADDVLDMHNLLKDFDGDLSQLFA
ncbi:MAG: hypothetical protein JRJ45_09960 [Deltaproteobacteria bacterium]|nr:hypothetical protein [Deltaproteobacteria bacterium]